MAAKVLSIEIGKGVTNVVEMDYHVPKTKVYNCFSFETPQGVIKDGMVTRNELFTTLFNNACSKYEIKTKKAVFVVSSSRLASRDVSVPLVKANRLEEVVNTSATEFFPVDMNLYHVVYKVLGKVNTADEKAWKLNALAVPNDLTASYYDLAASLDLELTALDYVGNSIMQTVGNKYTSGTNAVIKVEEENTLVSIIKDGKVVLQRMLSYGVSDTIQIVREHEEFGENLSYMDAIKLLSGKTIIRRYLNAAAEDRDEDDTDDSMMAARTEVTESLRYLIGNVGRVLDYYSARNNNDTIDEVAITGLGADFSGLSKLMTNELNHKFKVFTDFANASFTHEDENASHNMNAYAACVGAGMNPLNLIPKKTGSGAKEEKSRVNNTRTLIVCAMLGGVCLIVAFFLWFLPFMELQGVKSQEKIVQADIDRMRAEGVEEVYNDYQNAQTLNDHVNALNNATDSRSEELADFIEELEEKLPSDLLVLNFTATSSGVTMSIQCDSKEAAAKTLMQLRTLETVNIVSSSGLDDTSLDMTQVETDEEYAEEEYPVTFTVDLVYTPIHEVETTEAAPVVEDTDEEEEVE